MICFEFLIILRLIVLYIAPFYLPYAKHTVLIYIQEKRKSVQIHIHMDEEISVDNFRSIYYIKISPRNRRCLAGTLYDQHGKRSIVIIDYNRMRYIAKWSSTADMCKRDHYKFSPCGRYAAMMINNDIKVYDIDSGECILVCNNVEGYFTFGKSTPCIGYVTQNGIRIINIIDGTSTEFSADSVYCFTFAHNDTRIIATESINRFNRYTRYAYIRIVDLHKMQYTRFKYYSAINTMPSGPVCIYASNDYNDIMYIISASGYVYKYYYMNSNIYNIEDIEVSGNEEFTFTPNNKHIVGYNERRIYIKTVFGTNQSCNVMMNIERPATCSAMYYYDCDNSFVYVAFLMGPVTFATKKIPICNRWTPLTHAYHLPEIREKVIRYFYLLGILEKIYIVMPRLSYELKCLAATYL